MPRVSDLIPAFKRYALHERGMRPLSYKAIVTAMDKLCEHAGTDNLAALTLPTIKAYLYAGKEERAWEARTFRNQRQYLSSFFGWCVKQGHIEANPVLAIEKPKLPQRLPRCLTKEETQRILSHVRWHPWRTRFEAVRNEAILTTLVYTGLRLQEMLNLLVSDLDLEAGELLVRQGKGQKDRIIPIHPHLSRVLRMYHKARLEAKNHSPFLFTGKASEHPLNGKDIRRICHHIAKASNVPFTPHRLRHTFGRLAVEANLNLFTIKEIMGHSQITTTQGYLSVSTTQMKKSLSEADLL